MTRRSNTRTQNYLSGLGSGYAASIVTILTGIFLTPFTLDFLDREEYAIFIIASDLLIWLSLIDLGISSGLAVQAAQLSGKPDQYRLNTLVSTAFFAQLVVVVALLIVGSILSFSFPYLFSIRPDLQIDATLVMLLLVLSQAIAMGSRTFSALLVANQQIHIDNLIKLALVAVRTALTVILLVTGWGLFSIVIANLIATCVTSTMAVVRTFRLSFAPHLAWRLFSWEIFRGISNLGIWFTIGGLAGILILNLDRIVAAQIISLESVVILSLSGRLFLLTDGFLQQITNTSRPMLGQLLGEGELAKTLDAYRQIFLLSNGLALVAAASLWASNQSFIIRWVGAVNYGGPWLDIAFAVNLLVNVWILPNRALLSSNLVVKPQALSRIAEGFLNVGLSIFLAQQLGLIGVVIATALAGLLTSFWILPLLTARMFKLSLSELIGHNLARLLRLLFLLLPLTWLARMLSVEVGGFLGAAVGAAVVALPGVGLLWFLVFDTRLRQKVFQLLGRATQIEAKVL